MMKDPYLYSNSDVLKNLAGVRDSEELKNVEADYTLLRLSEIVEDESPEIFNFQTLCEVHYRIFQDVYDWAGKPRVINIEKAEAVLGDISVVYSDCFDIAKDATPDTFKMVIQNYSDTTLDNVTVDGTNLAVGNNYTVSNNFGDSVYKNNTRIVTADEKDFAFDVYYWPSNGYGDGVTVTIEDDSVEIDGKVEYAHDGESASDFMVNTALIVPAGYETKLTLEVTDYQFEWVDVQDKAGYKKVTLKEAGEV